MKNAKKRLLRPRNIADSGLVLFMREIATNPSAMGAAFPSSLHLAKKIAAQVPLNEAGSVLELGGGTGAVTAALLNKGIKPEQLIVVERSAKLTQHLQERFSQLNVIHGDACKLGQLISPTKSIQTVVSGLPLRSLPAKTVQTIGAELDNILEDGALYIQFTYSLYRPPLPPSLRLCWVHSEYSWWNLPPARIDVFRYAR